MLLDHGFLFLVSLEVKPIQMPFAHILDNVFCYLEIVGTLLGFDDFVNMVLEDVVELCADLFGSRLVREWFS